MWHLAIGADCSPIPSGTPKSRQMMCIAWPSSTSCRSREQSCTRSRSGRREHMTSCHSRLWGSLLSCGRLLIGRRRLPTAAQDNILPHILLLILSAAGLFGQATVRTVPNLPSYKDLKFPPLKEVQIPEPETFTLPNGL